MSMWICMFDMNAQASLCLDQWPEDCWVADNRHGRRTNWHGEPPGSAETTAKSRTGSRSDLRLQILRRSSGDLAALDCTSCAGIGAVLAWRVLGVFAALGLTALADFRRELGVSRQVCGVLCGQCAQTVAHHGDLTGAGRACSHCLVAA